MEFLEYLLLAGSAFLGSVISAIVGMIGGVVLLSLMTFFLPLSVVVPIHGIVQLASNLSRLIGLRQHLVKKILYPTMLTLPIGTALGTLILDRILHQEVFYLLIVALIFYVLFKPKKMPSLQIPYWAFAVLGFVVGVLNPIIGAIGPIYGPFLLRDDLIKEEIIATQAAMQALAHVLKVPAFLYLGFKYQEHLLLFVIMISAVVLGTKYGIVLFKRISDEKFRLFYRASLLFAALRLLYKAAGG